MNRGPGRDLDLSHPRRQDLRGGRSDCEIPTPFLLDRGGLHSQGCRPGKARLGPVGIEQECVF
jgi:hypothetical protein